MNRRAFVRGVGASLLIGPPLLAACGVSTAPPPAAPPQSAATTAPAPTTLAAPPPTTAAATVPRSGPAPIQMPTYAPLTTAPPDLPGDDKVEPG